MATLDNEQIVALKSLLSALLLAAEGPLKSELIVDIINGAKDEEDWPFAVTTRSLEDALYALQLEYDGTGGIELVTVAGGWRFRTSPALSTMVRRL